MSGEIESYIQSIVAALQNPEVEAENNREHLVQGYITRHLEEGHPLLEIAAIERSVCDVILLITAYEDNTGDVSLIHFYPSRRLATSLALTEIKDKEHKQGSRFALWLKSQPMDSEQAKQYGYTDLEEVFMQIIKEQLKEFLGEGQETDIITVALDYIFQREEVKQTNLLFTAARHESGILCRMSIEGTGYEKELLFVNGQLQNPSEKREIFVDRDGNVTQSTQ